jgi:hypothetical protein
MWDFALGQFGPAVHTAVFFLVTVTKVNVCFHSIGNNVQ